jgi:uncharacterized protein (DUF1330 family)
VRVGAGPTDSAQVSRPEIEARSQLFFGDQNLFDQSCPAPTSALPQAYVIAEIAVKGDGNGYWKEFVPARTKSGLEGGGKYLALADMLISIEGAAPSAQRVVLINSTTCTSSGEWTESQSFKDTLPVAQKSGTDIRTFAVEGKP